MAALVGEYYFLLRSVLRSKPHLRGCLTRCRHCRIFLLTHPRNAGRRDLRCAFGCREAHRKQASTRRSVQYYRNDKDKKRTQNSRRRVAPRPGDLPKDPKETPKERVVGAAGDQLPCPPSATQELPQAEDLPVVEYVRVVCSLVEGRRVSRREILEMLGKVLRQHPMGRKRKIDHTVAWLNAHPP